MVVPSDLVAWLTPNMDNPVPVDVDSQYDQREVCAMWEVPLKGHVHKIEFEHGTASGKRVIWLDGKEMLRREWMFKLVGEDSFPLDGVRCIIRVDPAPGFRYTYNLFVDGKPFKQFTERQARILKAWEVRIADKEYRIVLGEWWGYIWDRMIYISLDGFLYIAWKRFLFPQMLIPIPSAEKDTLNVWLNGAMRDETGEFVDDGADTEFEEDGIRFVLQSRSSGNKRTGIVYQLFANDELIDEVDQ